MTRLEVRNYHRYVRVTVHRRIVGNLGVWLSGSLVKWLCYPYFDLISQCTRIHLRGRSEQFFNLLD